MHRKHMKPAFSFSFFFLVTLLADGITGRETRIYHIMFSSIDWMASGLPDWILAFFVEALVSISYLPPLWSFLC